jgi:hypothetical protein
LKVQAFLTAIEALEVLISLVVLVYLNLFIGNEEADYQLPQNLQSVIQ